MSCEGIRTFIIAGGSSERRGDHRVDLRQVGGDLAPVLALLAHPDLAIGGAEIEAHGVAGVAAEGLALDGEPALFGGQPLVLPLPALAGVAGAIGRGPPAGTGARPDVRAVHRPDPGGVV